MFSIALTHWSGHTSRLNRDFAGRYGTEAYAFEELIAELGAAFLCSTLGITNAPREDHSAYLSSWLKVLGNDKRAIFRAAAAAQKAVDFLHELAEGLPDVVEAQPNGSDLIAA